MLGRFKIAMLGVRKFNAFLQPWFGLVSHYLLLIFDLSLKHSQTLVKLVMAVVGWMCCVNLSNLRISPHARHLFILSKINIGKLGVASVCLMY